MKVRLPTIGLLRIQGPDAKSFLQGQISCDVNLVTPENSVLGAYLNLKGRIIATFRLLYWQESYWLRMPIDVIPLFIKTLKHYVLFSKVTISDVSEEYGVCGVTDLELQEQDNAHVIPLESTARYEILTTKAQFKPQFMQLMTEEADPSYWDLLDIEAGIPTVYQATQEKFLPHHINFASIGVSFNKGCYLGQEIVARMQYRGQLKQHLYIIEIDTTEKLIPGMSLSEVSTNHELGELVMFAAILDGQYKALAVLPDEKAVSQAILINQLPADLRVISRC